MSWDALDITILGPALLAGMLVVSTHVPFGRAVLDRGIIFIDLAIAQIAGLGVIAASAFGWDPEGWGVQAAAVSAALSGALLLHWTEKKYPEIQEAIIGVSFVMGATFGLILLANNPHGGEHLKQLLVGQILWVGMDQLWPIALLYAVVLAIWFGIAGANKSRITFYALFAVTVTASVQLVGVYLVFATLIIPALATRKAKGWTRLASAYLLGVVAYAVGLAMSAVMDLPSGAVIVWTLAVLGMVSGHFLAHLNKARR
ncbi:MAG TPA: metal ABC transporter permease [Gammaproteobacteria bacterium]|nr:metal ABC transporter permease [Gammaproteobacteria bacterium]